MEDYLSKLSMYLPGFLMAIVFHEAAHAYVALRFGDDTAQKEGRLSLNPLVHMDIVGTVIFPLILIMMPGGMMFGWAKPVPVNSSRFKDFRKGIFWVSAAGPISNLILGTISAFLYAFLITVLGVSNRPLGGELTLGTSLVQILGFSTIINFILAGFNLIPLPPLDGSRMLSSFLSYNAMVKYDAFGKYSIIVFLIAMYTGAFSFILAPFYSAALYLIQFFSVLMG